MTQCDSAWWIRPLARLVGALVRAPLRAPLGALVRAAAFIGLLLGLTLAPADRASAQGAVKSVHGDWQIRCDTPPGAQSEQCALMQSVTAEDRPNIDNQDVGRAGFVRCLPSGCVAEVVMDDNLIKQLRTGQTSTFIIFQTPEEGIGFPMSLKGFGEGYDQLP